MTEDGAASLAQRARDHPQLGRAVAVGWVIYLASQANIARTLGSSIDQLIALQTSTSHARMLEVLASWTADDRAHFAAHLPLDLVHALIYPVVLALSLAYGFRLARVSSKLNPALWLPFVAGAMDQLENYAHWVAVGAAPDVPAWAFAAGAIGSFTKWALALSGVVALPILGGLAWKRREPQDAPPA